eukprot:2311639-Rhodomonas_salina.1
MARSSCSSPLVFCAAFCANCRTSRAHISGTHKRPCTLDETACFWELPLSLPSVPLPRVSLCFCVCFCLTSLNNAASLTPQPQASLETQTPPRVLGRPTLLLRDWCAREGGGGARRRRRGRTGGGGGRRR